jgi:hypothetical protein
MEPTTFRDEVRLVLCQAAMVGLRSFLETRSAPAPSHDQAVRIIRRVNVCVDELVTAAAPDAVIEALAHAAVLEAVKVACDVMKLPIRAGAAALN